MSSNTMTDLKENSDLNQINPECEKFSKIS